MAEPLAPWRWKELHPVGGDSDEAFMAAIRARADTIYHSGRHLPMGEATMARWVDPALRLRAVLPASGWSSPR